MIERSSRTLRIFLHLPLLIVTLLLYIDVISGLPSLNIKTVNETESTLKLVHVVFRHGPRTPVNTYPNDPYLNETFYPYGWGHLTNDAKRELFKIGKNLRKRYKDLLGSYYQYDLIHAQSTASPRTLMSLSTVLSSMFPPKGTPMEWNAKYNWQPIPIFSDPIEKDNLLRMTSKCPRYDEAYEEILQTDTVQTELLENDELFLELSDKTGWNITGAADINSLYMTLLAEKGYGLQLPEWTKDYFPERMQFMASQNYIYNTYTAEMRKIKAGFFLEKMFREMKAKADGLLKPKDRRMFLYCAHDWSITNILSAFNVWQRIIPRFSSMAAIELHKNSSTQEYYVEIYFQNDPSEAPKRLQIPDCGYQCPLRRLIELSADVLPDASFEEMCRPKNNSE